MSEKKPVIFISYARKDEPDKPKRGEVQWRSYVQSYLAPASLNGIVHIWVDEGIRGGDEWKKEIETQLKTCDLFILLVSISSLASDVVVNFEIKTIQQRQAKGDNVHIFPIVLEPFPKKAVPWLMELNLRPKAGKPLSEFSAKSRKNEMAAIADEVVEIIAQVSAEKELTQLGHVAEAPKTTQGVVETVSGRVVIDIAHLPETAYERLVGREAELKRLDDAWTDRRTNILSLIAEGGAGKSALVNEWLARLQADNYRGAKAVLGWSFYSQGTKERATSAEQFLNWAIERLGIKIETTSATAKGEAIAEAVANGVLLLLDGCEPLQHGLDKQHGELKDQGLRALLRRFAALPPAEVRGLVVLTSRLPIKDVVRWNDSSAPFIDVEKLSDEAGAALLRDNGVWGTDKELKEAAHAFGGHPLALGLLASFLKETQAGDVRRRDHVGVLIFDDDNPRHGHAKRVMESYEKEWLNGQPVLQSIMHLVGSFDRPASGDCLRALRAKPVIEGLTDAIVDLNDGEWQRAVTRLREARLLAPLDLSAPDALDAHPLVREWFGERLKQKNEAAWRAAHGRLYEYLRDATEEGTTPTLEDLAPLYQAIAHGCRAGRHEEALFRILIDRLYRQSEAYAIHKLGALSTNLAAISWFFDKPYETPVASLRPEIRSWMLAEAAFHLRAQGRFTEALLAESTSLLMAEETDDWDSASVRASNVSKSKLLVGDIDAALTAAAKSIEYGDMTGENRQIVLSRADLVDALHAAGRFDEAIRTVEESESLQREPKLAPVGLRFLQGRQRCDLLLATGQLALAQEHVTQTLEFVRSHHFLLDTALDTLTLGRAEFAAALIGVGEPSSATDCLDNTCKARGRLDEAIDTFRRAGTNHHVPRGLLGRAAFRRSIGDWDGAARDLDEVLEIAEPGPMKLYLCDMALEQARLALAKIEAFAPLNGLIDNNPPKPAVPDASEVKSLKAEAAKQCAIAADYIKSCGYHRRDRELAELEAVLRGARKFADLPPRV